MLKKSGPSLNFPFPHNAHPTGYILPSHLTALPSNSPITQATPIHPNSPIPPHPTTTQSLHPTTFWLSHYTPTQPHHPILSHPILASLSQSFPLHSILPQSLPEHSISHPPIHFQTIIFTQSYSISFHHPSQSIPILSLYPIPTSLSSLWS